MRLIKIILGIMLFGIFYLNTNALNIEVNTDKNDISVGEEFNLNIQIEGNLSGDFNLGEIKGLENFDILNKSQYQSSASKFVVINGKTQNESKIIYNISYSLKANKKGKFTIGPLKLTGSGSNITTNPININVSGGGLFGGKKTNNNLTNNNYQNFDRDNKSDFILNKTKENNYFDSFINIIKNLFFIILAFIPLFLLFYYFKNKEKFNSINFNNIKEKFNSINLNNIKEKFLNKNISYKEEEKATENIIKEEERIEDIYPNKFDINFISKLEDIFRNKIKSKYKLENIKNKTYVDILGDLENIEIYEKEKIKMLSNLFNKAKYSKILFDKDEIIELVKKI